MSCKRYFFLLFFCLSALTACNDHRTTPVVPANQTYQPRDLAGEWLFIGYQQGDLDAFDSAKLIQPTKAEVPTQINNFFSDSWEIVWADAVQYTVRTYLGPLPNQATTWLPCQFQAFEAFGRNFPSYQEPDILNVHKNATSFRLNTVDGQLYARFRTNPSDGSAPRALVYRKE
ncbi:hypothetical protein [Tellurirhabdus bombi]|uniref:hypothetical protein n=1 Tax=Tellurirhabdus bombi TaxID=2907205 RepID=UPI001F2BB3BF|nr:hypothetical protein [Tellurirhabdus bombi]